MGNDVVQIKFGADAAELLAVMQQVRASVSDGFQGIGQQINQLAGSTKQSAEQIIQANKAIESSVSSLQQRVSSNFKAMQAEIQSSTATIKNAVSSVTGLFASLGAIAAGAGVFNSAISASQRWTGEVVSLSKALGITTEQASGLNMALRLYGLESSEYIAMSMRMLMATRTNGEELERQGFRWREAGNDQAAMFQMALRWIGEATSGVERNSRAQLIFARSAGEAERFQKLTNQALEEGSQRAATHNMVVGRDGVEAYKAQNKQLNELKQSLDEVEAIIGNAVLPLFIKFGKWLNGEGKAAVQAFTAAVNVLGRATAFCVENLDKLGPVGLGLAASLKGLDKMSSWLDQSDDKPKDRTFGELRKPIPAPPPPELTSYTTADFDRALQTRRNLQENWYTWNADRELQQRKQDYEWAVQYYGAENQLIKDLWDRYADAARAANKDAHKAPGSGGGGGGSRDFRSELDEELAEERAAGVDTKRYELARWNERLEALKEGSREYQEALREVNRLAREIAAEDAKAREDARKEEAKDNEAKTAAASAHEGAGIGLREEEVRTRKELGQISAQEELTQLQQLEDRKYEIEQAAVWKRIELLRAAGELTKAEETKLYGQIEAIQDKQALSQLQTLNKIKVDQANTWKTIATQISSTMTNAITGMLSKTQSLANGLKSIWNSIAAHIIGKVSETTVQFIAEELRKTIFAWTQEGSRTAAATAGVVARDGIQDAGNASGLAKQAATGMKAVFNDAKLAASGAYQSASQIPYVGWLLGPIAAAAAFAAVMAFGTLTSAAGGWGEVPEDQLAMVHKSEMVLPAHLARQIREISDPSATISRAVNLAVSSAFGPAAAAPSAAPALPLAGSLASAVNVLRNGLASAMLPAVTALANGPSRALAGIGNYGIPAHLAGTIREIANPFDAISRSVSAAISSAIGPSAEAASALPLAGSMASAVNVLRNGLVSAMLPAVTALANGPSRALAGIGNYGIPADKLTFTRAVLSGGGLTSGATRAGDGVRTRSGGDMHIHIPVTALNPKGVAEVLESSSSHVNKLIRDWGRRGKLRGIPKR